MKTHLNGFTLIELLIVVAIIGILAAIAVPNFLNAQIRAKVSRTMSDLRTADDMNMLRKMDTGLWMIDGNDDSEGEHCRFKKGLKFWGKLPSKEGIQFGGLREHVHFSGQIWEQLTTPTAYLNSPIVDPFGNGVFLAFDDWNCSNGAGNTYIFFACGPDRDIGEWQLSGAMLTGKTRTMSYDVSNGLSSSGDIVRCRVIKESGAAHREFYGCL